MKNFCVISIFLLGVIPHLLSQNSWQEIIETPLPNVRMSSSLYHLAQYEMVTGRENLNLKIRSKSLVSHPDGRLKVEVVNRNEGDIDATRLGRLGLDVTAEWRNRASGFIAPEGILEFHDRLPAHFFIKAVTEIPANDEGPDTMNISGYINAGKNGSGIKIAIIDSGYDELSDAVTQGDVPSNYTAYDHTGTGIEAGGNEHGTGCLEVAYDNAPGATYYIHKTSNGTEFGQAVDQAIDDGVDIISTSLGPHNTGWDDNTGPYCQAVIDAVNAGMLVFVTAGNEAQKHWQGDFFDTNSNDNWHDWSGSDSYLQFSINGMNSSSSTALAWLQWDSDESTDHYDLYLYNSSFTIVDQSTSTSEFESVSWGNTSTSSANVHVRVVKKTANPPPFELFVHPFASEYFTSNSSIECPANTTTSNCISVGAVPHVDYTTAAGGTPIAGYSSHGPTNGGSQAPDICAVTNSTTNAYEGAFSGTSCSAPNAAGAAAALWSSLPNYSASGIRQLLFRQAKLFRDWGAVGTDMIHGNGGLYLKNYKANTIYVYEFSGNNNGTNVLPYSSIQQADQFGPSGFNAFFLGHTHEQPPAGTVIDRPMIYRSVGQSSIIH